MALINVNGRLYATTASAKIT
eukprot:COSAG01_NODE_63493_length_279_cov_8.527778_1_plen_20_part_01